MSKRKHGKKRCRVAGRKPQPKGAARAIEPVFVGRSALDDDHPLVVAFRRGTVNQIQYQAGDHLRTICLLRERSGRDSTDIQPPSGGKRSADGWFTDALLDARRAWLRIRERLGGAKSANWIICLKLCGEGWSIPDAILAAGIPCHEDHRRDRIQEALNALAGVKETKPGRTKIKEPKAWLQRICPGCSRPLLKCTGHDASRFLHEGARLVLCGPCSELEPKRIFEHGEVMLRAIYHQNLYLPPTQLEQQAEQHMAKRNEPTRARQAKQETGWKGRHKGFASMKAA